MFSFFITGSLLIRTSIVFYRGISQIKVLMFCETYLRFNCRNVLAKCCYYIVETRKFFLWRNPSLHLFVDMNLVFDNLIFDP